MRPVLVLAVLTLAACSPRTLTSAGLDPYGALPSSTGRPAQSADSLPRPGEERLAPALRQSGVDDVLLQFLSRVTASAEAHDWRRLAGTLDSAEYAQQFTFLTESGLGPRRAAAEALGSALGLGTVSPAVLPDGADREAAPFAALDRIRTVTVERVDDEDAEFHLYRLSGTIGLADGSTRPLALTVYASGPGRFALAVPQG